MPDENVTSSVDAIPTLDDLQSEYEVLGELGRGGSAIVYRARDRMLGREVAVKVVRPSGPMELLPSGEIVASHTLDESLARLAREARAVARLQHSNIVGVFAIRRLRQGGLALVMELVPGPTLKQVLHDEGPLDVDRAERILCDVAQALACAHASGIVHRDVKPENIFLHATTGRAMLADFGIARLEDVDARLTQTGTTIGTPAYMSPEQIAGGALDGRSDLYSLALVGWEMLTGRQPWAGAGFYDLLTKQRHETLPPIDAVRPAECGPVPLRLQYMLERALQKTPAARWAGADGFLAQLSHTILPEDYRRWVPAHQRRVEAYRRAADARHERFVDTALSTMRVVRESLTQRLTTARTPVGTAAGALPADAAAPEWSASHAWSLGRRVALVAAVAVLAAGALGAYTLARPVIVRKPTTIARVDRGAIEVPVSLPPIVTTDTTAQGMSVVDSTRVPNDSAKLVTPVIDSTIAKKDSAPVEPTITPTIQRGTIAAGARHTCAVLDGRLACWGANERGQLGARASDPRSAPADVGGGIDLAQIAAGSSHSCGLTRGGEAFCWGENAHGELGDATTEAHDVPAPIVGSFHFRAIEAGRAHTCGVTTAGFVACWGANGDGQIGDGSAAPRTVPAVAFAGDVRFVAVATGARHTCALSTTGVAFCWGWNDGGQLGDGSHLSRRAPTPVTTALRFVSIAAGGSHTCAVATDGAAYCWGADAYGQIGNGAAGDRPTPTRVASLGTVVSVVAGLDHACARNAAGTAWCWGRNDSGQLGDGTTVGRVAPVRVAGGASFRELSAAASHTCGVTTDGAVSCWGNDDAGQLGDGQRASRPTPARVERPAP